MRARGNGMVVRPGLAPATARLGPEPKASQPEPATPSPRAEARSPSPPLPER